MALEGNMEGIPVGQSFLGCSVTDTALESSTCLLMCLC
jgi:hypothetical protein